MQTKYIRSSLIALFLLSLHAASLAAQQPGRIIGRVIDAETRRGLTAVSVHVVGSSRGTVSGAEGRFVLDNVPAGAVTLQATSLGYATQALPVVVRSGVAVEQDVELRTEAVAIEALEVSASAPRGSVDRALEQQRDAVGLVSTVTAEQITRSPDSDAAQAVQRMSGATVQDGKFIIVRGLGERYTTTSLNGTRVPSAEPERRLVPLDIFPSALLEEITTAKTFTPDQSGDFTGASVNIQTRDFPGSSQRSLSLSFGYNPLVTGKSFSFAPAAGNDWLAFGASSRTPDVFRNVWSPTDARATPNTSLGFTVAGNRLLPQSRQIGYVLGGTYASTREMQSEQVRAQAQAAGDGTVEIDRYEGATTRQSVLWGGIANFSALLSGNSRIAFNNTYNRSADNEARMESGTSENYGNLALDITRLRYVERAVRSHQLRGFHELDRQTSLDWSIATSAVSRKEPDRSEIVYAREADPQTGALQPAAWFASAAEGAVRTFGDLAENSWEIETNFKRELGNSEQNHLKVGVLARRTERDTQNDAFSITAPLLPRAERTLAPEEVFESTDERFRTAPLAQGGSYQAEDNLVGGYALFEWNPSERLRVSVGARAEHSDVRVVTEPTVGANLETNPAFTDVLPSLAINFKPREHHVLKLSATQTLSRPEYRELAGVQYREVLGGDNVIGNPALRRTLVRNLDLRYELYPSPGEVISLAGFAKFFHDPIERVYLGTSGTRVVTFLNAEAARNYGVELELRKRVADFTAFTNLTLMHSQISIGDTASGASRINDERPMVGQSPYVVNAGLTWQPSPRLNATVLYNVFGKRIQSAAEMPLPDVYELPRHALDVSIRWPLSESVSAKLDVRNILDQRFETVQGSTIRESYRTGRVLSLGASWQP